MTSVNRKNKFEFISVLFFPIDNHFFSHTNHIIVFVTFFIEIQRQFNQVIDRTLN